MRRATFGDAREGCVRGRSRRGRGHHLTCVLVLLVRRIVEHGHTRASLALNGSGVVTSRVRESRRRGRVVPPLVCKRGSGSVSRDRRERRKGARVRRRIERRTFTVVVWRRRVLSGPRDGRVGPFAFVRSRRHLRLARSVRGSTNSRSIRTRSTADAGDLRSIASSEVPGLVAVSMSGQSSAREKMNRKRKRETETARRT